MFRVRPSTLGRIFTSSSSNPLVSCSSFSSLSPSRILSSSSSSPLLTSSPSASSSSSSRPLSSLALPRTPLPPFPHSDEEERKPHPSSSFPFFLPHRPYSRRATSTPSPTSFSTQGRRRVKVLEQEPEQQQQQQQQESQLSSPWQQKSDTPFQETDRSDANQREIDALTPGAVEHLRKVYSTLGATLGVATAGTLVSLVTPLGMINPLIPGLGALLPLLGIYFTNPATTSPTLRMGLLTSFSFMSGMSLAPLVGFSLAMNPMLVPTALGLSTAVFGAMTAMTFFGKKRAFLKLGGPLLGGSLILLGTGIASFFVPASSIWYPVLHNTFLYGGLALFSAFVAYDTSMVLDDYEKGERDVVRHATNFFINFKGLFVRILQILTFSQND